MRHYKLIFGIAREDGIKNSNHFKSNERNFIFPILQVK